MSIACGTYNLTGSFNSGYEFSSWSKGGSGSIANTGTLSTKYTVNGTGSITLNGKQSFVNLLTQATYMQDLTAAQCSGSSNGATATLRDRRDNNTYTIAKINGYCWMTQNLRLAGGTTLTPATSNVASNYTVPTTDLTAGDSYTQGRIHDSGSDTYGYWYNFCAASAGTVCSESQINSTNDICPAGWRLPTNSEFGDIIGTSYVSAFSPVTGGAYSGGSLSSTGRGRWWSSSYNSYGSGNQGNMNYEEDEGLYRHSVGPKYLGLYVRCIRSS